MKLSIITINYNNVEGLMKTIESVVAQKCRDFEYIVIDGGSTDGSVDVIKEYADRIDYWVSEPDSGIYNAMNKGTRAAHGDFCQYLNSGDWLYDENVVGKILPHLDEEVDILATVTRTVNPSATGRRALPPEQLSILTFLTKCIIHQATFIRRSLLLKRPYREDYKIVSDWIFFFESYLYDNVQYRRVEINTVFYDETGISSNEVLLAQEKVKFEKSIAPENLLREFALVPTDIFDIYRELEFSFRLKQLLATLITAIVRCYFFIRRVGLINRI